MRNFCIYLLLFLFQVEVFGRIQISDVLIIGSDTFYIRNTAQIEKQLPRFKIHHSFANNNKYSKTNCRRGYFAEWIIQNDSLFLVNIYSCKDRTKADLRKIFNKKKISQGIFADFFSCTFFATKNYHLKNSNVGEYFLNESGKYFVVKKGRIISTSIIYEKKPHVTIYSENDTLRENIIYKSIDWTRIPFLDNFQYSNVIIFTSNENGIIDSVNVVKGNDDFEEILIEAIKSIPEWDIYYNYGKYIRIPFKQEIIISEENRKKYYGTGY